MTGISVRGRGDLPSFPNYLSPSGRALRQTQGRELIERGQGEGAFIAENGVLATVKRIGHLIASQYEAIGAQRPRCTVLS